MTTITGRDIDLFAISQLVIMCDLQARTGMKPNRNTNPIKIAKITFDITGRNEKIVTTLKDILDKAKAGVWPENYVFRNALDKGMTGREVNAEEQYIDFFNNYLTIEKFALDKGMKIHEAESLLAFGKDINHRRGVRK